MKVIQSESECIREENHVSMMDPEDNHVVMMNPKGLNVKFLEN